jgi:hypothetical protein
MFNIPLSKLYSNCLMSALNARSQYNRTLNGGLNNKMSTGATGATSMTLSAPTFSPNPKAGQVMSCVSVPNVFSLQRSRIPSTTGQRYVKRYINCMTLNGMMQPGARDEELGGNTMMMTSY